ncbi:hypothetical protein D6764_03615 [Candidatus Woesearchaeota archaeon]|nr:MAG: hypothetical protein D6764_03615 [Candidatus Woesearchaeota archaeon]
MIITIDTEKDGVKEFRAALNLLKSLLNERESREEPANSSGVVSDEGATAFGSLFGSEESSAHEERKQPEEESRPDQIFLEPY